MTQIFFEKWSATVKEFRKLLNIMTYVIESVNRFYHNRRFAFMLGRDTSLTNMY